MPAVNPPHPTIFPLVKQMAHALHTLERFLQLCRRLGLDVTQGRYVTYRTVQAERIEALTRNHVTAIREMRRNENLLGTQWLGSLLELETIVSILPYLETRPDAELHPKLEKVLKGPIYLDGERGGSSSNDARNFLAELVAATQFWKVGLTPELGEHPEIRLGDVAGGPVFIQCKRLFSTSRDAIARRIAEAANAVVQARPSTGSPGRRVNLRLN